MPNPDPEYLAVLPTLEYSHKPGTGGVKCALCNDPAEYREYNESTRKVGPKRAFWLCPACHSKVKGNPEPPQDIPADPIPEQSQNVEERDQKENEQSQNIPEVIEESPVSENKGSEQEPTGTENGTEVEPPRPPTPVPCQTRGEYHIPDLLGDVSMGILRTADGFIFTFYRQGVPVEPTHRTKTAPWLSPKIVKEIGTTLEKACPGLPYTRDHIRDTLGETFQTVAAAIQTNPKAADLLTPPTLLHVLSKVDRVAVTLFKDGLGGSEPVYELFTGRGEDEEPRTVTLSLGDMTADTPGLFKKRWTAYFPTDFLVLNREDWISLRQALIDRSDVREVEHTGEGDALISDLLQELRYLTFTTRKDTWKKDPKNYLLCEHTPDGWFIYANAVIIISFLKKNDITDLNSWTQKLSKACKNRNLTAGPSKKVRVAEGTIRAWVFKGDALGFQEEMLVEAVVVPDPQNVPGLGNVPGKMKTTPEQGDNAPRTEQEPEGV